MAGVGATVLLRPALIHRPAVAVPRLTAPPSRRLVITRPGYVATMATHGWRDGDSFKEQNDDKPRGG